VRVNCRLGVAPARKGKDSVSGSPWGIVCGVLAGAAGEELGASLINRNQVNTGTIPDPPFPYRNPMVWRVGPLPTDRCGVGRSRRSTPRTGKPRMDTFWGARAQHPSLACLVDFDLVERQFGFPALVVGGGKVECGSELLVCDRGDEAEQLSAAGPVLTALSTPLP
jgi:hypothetical protein